MYCTNPWEKNQNFPSFLRLIIFFATLSIKLTLDRSYGIPINHPQQPSPTVSTNDSANFHYTFNFPVFPVPHERNTVNN